MKKLFVTILALGITLQLSAQSKKELAAEVTQLKAEIAELKKPREADTTSRHQKASYGLGVVVGTNLKMQGGDSLDIETLTIALRDAYLGKELKMNPEKGSAVVQQYLTEAAEARAEKAKKEGVEFLEKNKQQEGVKVTESGLQYKVISSGNGKMPAETDRVTVNYVGKLVDGTVFDDSSSRPEPTSFNVNQVIPGWTEALKLMREGDKWMLYIPSDLAYGPQGAGGQIPPYATLIFEVELVKVN